MFLVREVGIWVINVCELRGWINIVIAKHVVLWQSHVVMVFLIVWSGIATARSTEIRNDVWSGIATARSTEIRNDGVERG